VRCRREGIFHVPEKVDLYDSAYGNNDSDAYRKVRIETYGADLGQTSWVDSEELAEIPRLLQIDASSNVLEIGCGAGGCALHFAAATGCRVTGIDLNAHGIRAAERSAHAQQLADRVRFLEHNASLPLPFPDETFDAAYSNDAFCHIPNRLGLLRECRRVLKPGARLLFSDALVVNGEISHEEIAARSSIGYYIFVPRGENERLIRDAGLAFLETGDTTAQAAAISQRWRDARERRKNVLLKMEGRVNFEGLQRFLGCVHTLTAENRLARFVYVVAK
jgi:SAM-dependent methyltransferase